MYSKRRVWIFWMFVCLAIAYAALVIFLPADARSLNKYNLSSVQAKTLSFTFALPYIAIWFTALYGYDKFKTYAEKIENSGDGKALSKIADGLLALALSMPISAVASNITSYFRQLHPNLLPAMTIINNYVNLFLVLIAFYIIYHGTRQLSIVLRRYNAKPQDAEIIPLLFILFSTAYSYFTFTNPARSHATAAAKTAAFYLPDWLLVISIVVPYIIVWYLGLTSVIYLRAYIKYVPGVLYKKALRYLVKGVFFVTLSIMVLRMLTSMTGWFEDQTLKLILGIVYLLLILIGSGYALIAKGARKLEKIEGSI